MFFRTAEAEVDDSHGVIGYSVHWQGGWNRGNVGCRISAHSPLGGVLVGQLGLSLPPVWGGVSLCALLRGVLVSCLNPKLV